MIIRSGCAIIELQRAGIAQLVEQLNRNQHVGGSSPLAGSIRPRENKPAGAFLCRVETGGIFTITHKQHTNFMMEL